VQLRFATALTSTDYVTQQAWRSATLAHCPRHPQGGCGFARHGTYGRVRPRGTRIARWYCPDSQQTFRLLPDCLAARLTGTLLEVEAAVDQVECAHALEAAAAGLRLEIELPGALRWLRRRVQAVHTALRRLKGLLPVWFAGGAPRLETFRQCLGVASVVLAVRALGADHLPFLPAPLGFRPRSGGSGESQHRSQHRVGPDPPRGLA
jgi:hypothetical protein